MLSEKLAIELDCAIGAIFGSQEDKINEELEKGKKLNEVITEQDLDAIVKKMKFYIFD